MPPLLLQGHRPDGEPQCMVVVRKSRGSGGVLVSGSKQSHRLIEMGRSLSASGVRPVARGLLGINTGGAALVQAPISGSGDCVPARRRHEMEL